MGVEPTGATVTSQDGVTIALSVGGPADASAPPLVATHGWANEKSVWSPMMDDLTTDHLVAAWDLRGHGDSDTPPPGQYSRDHALSDLKAVCNHVRNATTGPLVLMGHSLGGFLSLVHTLLNPADVVALILVATGPGFRKPAAREQWNDSVRAAATKMGQAPGVEEVSMHHDSFVIDRLTEIHCPTLVLLGERDKRFAASASLFERDLDVRASVVVPGQGHMVHQKAPTECAAAVRSFLTDVYSTAT